MYSLESVEFDSIPRCIAMHLPWARLARLVYDSAGDPLPKSPIVEHKSLKSLVLKCIPFAVVLDMLYLPNLQELTIDHTAQASYTNLLEFLRRSNQEGNLTKLTLFLEELEGALTRSMSSSSLPSSLPPSPSAESGPSKSPFVPGPNASNSEGTSSLTEDHVLSAASSLTTLVIEDWTPTRNPSPLDTLFIIASRSDDGNEGIGLLKSVAAMTPGFGITPSLGLGRSNSLTGSASGAGTLPPHLQQPGLPLHLANNPHIAAASAHLAALGLQRAHTPYVILLLVVSQAIELASQAPPKSRLCSFAETGMSQSAKPLSPDSTSNSKSEESLNEAERAETAVDAAYGVLGIPTDHSDVLLPNLKSPIISNLSRDVVDLHLLAGMLELRWRGKMTDLARSKALSGVSPSVITSLSLHTDLRLIKNKGSVGRVKASRKEAEEKGRFREDAKGGKEKGERSKM
ncbi:hypothetical protein D9757_010942 [Collybiopsis confluens]|uniref:Uncharacterized protein n=1 Tax=Collybiopsis confluens TaxID=2823264 RepID=A0A8H5LQW8_9AGAR|nr:hypothetical protein D9757_010942 [Collybiopsis confluens]